MPKEGPHQSDFTDAMMAEMAAKYALAGHFCWTHALGWLQWDGKRWQQCPDVVVKECVRGWVKANFNEAVNLMRTGQIDEGPVKKWFQALTRTKINAIVDLSRGIDGVIANAKDFDAHPDLLNVDNGIVDLRTGQRMPHDPQWKLTKITAVAYHPAAVHADWAAALEAIPADVRDWYQVRCGQAITGYMTPDDVMIMQIGGGDNGKSTVTGAIMSTLGDYAVMVSDKVILADPRAHSTERMSLRGARFALIEELPEARRLSVSMLKKVLGTPRMEARFVCENQTEWAATHSLFLSSNYTPLVEEVDHGTWRRLLKMTFPYTFLRPGAPCIRDSDRPGKPGLRASLAQTVLGPQHEAVLAWLVAGAVSWYAMNRVMPAHPQRIVRDTREWRAESDLVLGYLDDHLAFDHRSHVMAAELLEHFNEWLVRHGHHPWSDKLLASRFAEHHEMSRQGVIKKKVKASNAVSRSPQSYPLDRVPPPPSYAAWVGVRFDTQGATWEVPAVPGENIT